MGARFGGEPEEVFMYSKRLAAALIAPAALASLSGCGVNAIPTAEEEAKAAWANVQNQYQRRRTSSPISWRA
jgi:LemA protein